MLALLSHLSSLWLPHKEAAYLSARSIQNLAKLKRQLKARGRAHVLTNPAPRFKVVELDPYWAGYNLNFPGVE